MPTDTIPSTPAARPLNAGARHEPIRLSVLRDSPPRGSRVARGWIGISRESPRERRSSRRRLAVRTRVIMAFVLGSLAGPVTAAAGVATAAPSTPLVPLVRGPLLAARDAVLGIPVAATTDGPASAVSIDPALPDTAIVRLADGRELEGLIAILAPPTTSDPRSVRVAAWPDTWTRGPGTVTVLAPSEARRRGRPGPALLLIRTPPDAEGRLTVGQQTLDVRWRAVDRPYTGVPLPGPTQPRLAREARADRPDPDDPLSWWRWVLLADELGWRPPPPPGDERSRRLAEHLAAQWRLGLARLGTSNPGVASALRDALTVVLNASAPASSADPTGRPAGPAPPELPPAIAGWRSNPDDLNDALRRMLDLDRPIARVASELVVWIDAYEPVLAWPEAPDPAMTGRVALHLANRSNRPETIRIAWEADPRSGRTVVLPARSLCRLDLRRPRPDLDLTDDAARGAGREIVGGGSLGRDDPVLESNGEAAAGARTRPDVLLVTDRRSTTRRIAWAPTAIVVRPPGIDLSPTPRLTLAAVERGAFEDAAAVGGLSMSARVRRRADRWELFIECRRPPGTADDAIEVRLGPIGGGRILVVPESGEPQWSLGVLEAGDAPAGGGDRPHPWSATAASVPATDPPPVFARRSWADRWYVRVEIPTRWVQDGTLDVAIRRRLDGGQRDADITAPGPAPAWQEDPGRLRLDLRRWDD
jgi:hypothetical protein